MKRLKAKNLKEQNYIDIVKLLKIGNYSRADIAYNLELSKASISVLVDDLIKMGIIYEKCDGESSSVGGKRPILLDINKNIGYFIAVHFRRELCNIAVVNLENEILEECGMDVSIFDDFRLTFNPIIEKIKEFIIKYEKIFSVGISVPGKIGKKNNLLIDCMGIKEWSNIPLKEYIEKKLNIEVIIDRYACAMLTYNMLEEMKKSMPIQTSSVYIYLSNWIGVSVSNNGKILYGTHDTAANYSHTIVTDSDYICNCGKKGCWESVASITAFMKEIKKIDGKYSNLSFNDIIEKHINDYAVINTYKNFLAHWVSIGIYNIINTFDPEIIFIGGEMLYLGDSFIEEIKYNIKNKFNSYNFVTDIQIVDNFKNIEINAAASVAIYDFYNNSLYRKLRGKYI
ncbi:ROK family transcriptional regulator [Brachyspira pilosicoli]|uniref:ROK family transcriptional regulator n=1 Tax=Brachyspira pilosicoli TaxID=52584 RepID=UPI000C76E931|nr:ROK family transcriptional regulator [Brachyspira pilosicoli]PLV55915.1 ROK family transcriptional regulator [Brachyspira pilosicoli SP16]